VGGMVSILSNAREGVGGKAEGGKKKVRKIQSEYKRSNSIRCREKEGQSWEKSTKGRFDAGISVERWEKGETRR